MMNDKTKSELPVNALAQHKRKASEMDAKPSLFDHDYGLTQTITRSNSPKFNLLGSPMKEYIDSISGSESDSDWVLRCVCHKSDESGDMICCDKCNAWQHMSCIGLDSEALPNTYYCFACQTELPEAPEGICQADAELKTEPMEEQMQSHQENGDTSSESVTNNLVKSSNSDLIPPKSQCNCLPSLRQLLAAQKLSIEGESYDGYAKNKNCHSFTLKNGQKILKSSKSIDSKKFICEMKGDIHILNSCSYIRCSYNASSSFLFTLNLDVETHLVVDARGSNHFSRYIRRSCLPNAELSAIADPESPKNVKVFLYALEAIEKNREVTLAVDRSRELLDKYPTKAIKHHWQKYDYSSSLVCMCGQSRGFHDENLPSDHAFVNSNFKCSIPAAKALLKSLKIAKKAANDELTANSHQTENDSTHTSSSSDGERKKPKAAPSLELSISTQGMTREEKKFNYWLRVINQMEQKTKKSENKPKTRKTAKPSEDSVNTEQGWEAEVEASATVDFVPKTPTTQYSAQQQLQPTENDKCDDTFSRWWCVPKMHTEVLLNNCCKINTSLEHVQIDNYRTGPARLPIKLALRRGFYNLVAKSMQPETVLRPSTSNECVSFHRRRFSCMREIRNGLNTVPEIERDLKNNIRTSPIPKKEEKADSINVHDDINTSVLPQATNGIQSFQVDCRSHTPNSVSF